MRPHPTLPTRLRRTFALALAGTALLAAGAASPASAYTLQKGFWGPVDLDGVSQFPLYQKLGVTVYQAGLSWDVVAPTKPADPKDPKDPAYRWPADLDRVVSESRKHGMSVLLAVINAPRWANGDKPPEYAPTSPQDFAAFTRAAARRYPSVRRWMIWAEPSRADNWKPFVNQPIGAAITPAMAKVPQRYSRLLDAAYGQLKAQRSSNLVIGGNTYTTGEIRPIDWVRNMRLPNGRPPRMDLYGHNPFSVRRPNLRNPASGSRFIDFSDLGRFDNQIQRDLRRPGARRIRLFLSEFTVPTGPDVEFNFHVTPKTQATWIKSAFDVARQLRADGLGWIHLRDDPPIRDGTAIAGGLLTHDGKRKPGFYAFMRGGR